MRKRSSLGGLDERAACCELHVTCYVLRIAYTLFTDRYIFIAITLDCPLASRFWDSQLIVSTSTVMAEVMGMIASVATIAGTVSEGLKLARTLYNASDECDALQVSQRRFTSGDLHRLLFDKLLQSADVLGRRRNESILSHPFRRKLKPNAMNMPRKRLLRVIPRLRLPWKNLTTSSNQRY